jgi:hypothetical protein
MPSYSRASLANLTEVHPKLQKLFSKVIQLWDNSVLDGARTIEEQKKNVASGVSQTMNSLHLRQEDGYSHAVDVMSYPYDWNQLERGLNIIKKLPAADQVAMKALIKQYAFMNFVLGMGTEQGINMRLGIDWDRDHDFWDSSFIDIDHVEMR